MRVLIISPKNKTIFNFRGDLIKDMIAQGHDVCVIGPNDDFLDEVMALNIKRFIKVPFVKDNTSLSNDIHYYLNLKKAIKDVKPDIVFSYNIKPVIYGSMAAKSQKVPHIYAMVAGLGRVYSSSGLKAKAIRLITKILYKKAFHACEKVIFQNADDIEELTQEGYLPKSKAQIVNGSGVNMDRFKKSAFPEKPVYLMISRIIKEKGILEYCEAARIIKQTHPEARCILLGGFDTSLGALKVEDIQEFIDDGSIEFLGEVDDPVSYYALSSVYVLPSYYREGLPRTILEAMACGRPIITTDWVGCREPVNVGINGYLVPIKDISKLARKMDALCNMNLAKKMGEASYMICKKKYEISIVNAQMRKIIGY